jgi:hypothetical protein
VLRGSSEAGPAVPRRVGLADQAVGLPVGDVVALHAEQLADADVGQSPLSGSPPVSSSAEPESSPTSGRSGEQEAQHQSVRRFTRLLVSWTGTTRDRPASPFPVPGAEQAGRV